MGTSAVTGLGFIGCKNFLMKEACAAAAKTSCKILDTSSQMFALPAGFRCQPISLAGEEMDDGLLVPGRHDGMAAFAGAAGRTILLRNHELYAHDLLNGAFGWRNQRLKRAVREKLYDDGGGSLPCLGAVTTLVYNTRTAKLEKQFLSLCGTQRNCSGGPTPWQTWITCEENVQRAVGTFQQDHGYCFEVPVTSTPRLTKAVPLKAMGRFNHEAVAVEARSGVVYQTEDRKDGLFYRYVPQRKGKLAAGGRLQALKINALDSADTRNWQSVRGKNIARGQRMAVEWVNLENVESPKDDLRLQGAVEKGAAKFARGEGMWCDGKAVYFSCTIGGRTQKGQIWRYVPSAAEGTRAERKTPATLELFAEPENSNLLENCDNLTVAPWGDLIICEDCVVCEDGNKEAQFIVGITPKGQLYRFARNTYSPSETSGVTFSPDGSTLFVNIQKPGVTVAITGPWHKIRPV